MGSSSIRLWETARAFPDVAVINRGFGGAHLSDVLAHFDRVVAPYVPRAVVLYCGDNDVADVWKAMLETGGPPAARLFAEDGLHLSREGYVMWNRVVAEALARAFGE